MMEFNRSKQDNDNEKPAVEHLVDRRRNKVVGRTMIKVRTPKEKSKKFECEICHEVFRLQCVLESHKLSHQKQPCRVCNREFRPDNMEGHLKTHANEKERKLQCKICPNKFLTARSLQRHVSHHKEKEKGDFECQICTKKFNVRQNFNKHMRFHAKFLKCDHCGFLFKHKAQLRVHMKKKHMAAEVFNCRTCSKTFKSKRALKEHQMTHQKKIECDVCGRKFAGKGSFFKDHLIHHFNPKAFKCDICDSLFASRSSVSFHKIVVHQSVQKPRKFECQICQILFKTRGRLKNHQLVHQDKKTCDICHKSFSASTYKKHLNLHELKKQEKKFKCLICQRKFYTKRSLGDHSKSHEPFECDLCGHRVAQKNCMKRHMDNHLKMFDHAVKCVICDQTFTTISSDGKLEIPVHQMSKQPLKFECHICQKRSKTRSILKRRQKVHQVRKTCDICHKQITASSLNQHMTLHELKKQKKKFECQVCQNKFFTKELLTRHSMTHKKPFECDLCGHRVAQKGIMKRHWENHLKVTHKMIFKSTNLKPSQTKC
jgi:KRAB domain-containing zinc finger protein